MRNIAPIPLLVAVLIASPLAFAKGQDIDKVNGSIRTEAGTDYGDLDTVNGSISIEKGTTAESASTVNGGIEVDDQATVGSLETVNGGIDIGAAVEVADGVETVNGSVDIDRGSRVHGKVETVNGRIELEGAEIDNGIATVNGDIIVGADSVVRGGILVEKPQGGWFSFGNGNKRKPRIVIGPNATVEGTLDFEREVELFVHDSAKIGTVRGATAVKFSGATP
jgi:DUF4097 and DUF4098 domain-containing protein YvlB